MSTSRPMGEENAAGYVCPVDPRCWIDHRDETPLGRDTFHWVRLPGVCVEDGPHSGSGEVTIDLFRYLHPDGSQAHDTRIELLLPETGGGEFRATPADMRRLAARLLNAADEADHLNTETPADGECSTCAAGLALHTQQANG